jgi:predicted nucleotidyltransferase
MDEDVLDQQIRRFLKRVGITSQREIESAVRAAQAHGDIAGEKSVAAVMTLDVPALGVHMRMDGDIALEDISD